MDASESNPGKGNESSDASVDYQQLGQTLLRWRLEHIGYSLQDEFTRVSRKAGRGEEIDRDDLRQLEYRVERASMLVSELREAMES
jgi:hypothetical protein